MAAALTIRNFSSSPLTLKHVSRFKDPNSLQSRPSRVPFIGGNTSRTEAEVSRLQGHAQTYTEEDVDIQLLPFHAYTLPAPTQLNHESSSTSPGTVAIRLTICDPSGERHRIDTNPSYTQRSSVRLTPLTPNPSTTYSALFHPANPIAHLTIHTHHLLDLSTWMTSLPPTLPLSALSIPGTHNSHTHYRALPSVRCQVVDISTQLSHGIRFLDIRLQPSHATDSSKKDLLLVHGAFPVSLTGAKYFGPVLESCYQFLEKNPGETILLSLKREGTGGASDEMLSRVLERWYFGERREMWYFPPTGTEGEERIPYLGDVRGKIVLIRRYNTHSASPSEPQTPTRTRTTPPGLTATLWPHNTPHSQPTPTFPFSLQDYCEVLQPSAIAHKLSHSTSHLARSASTTSLIPGYNTDPANPCPPNPFFLNFLSGSNFWRVECWPDRIASVVNRGVEEWVVREMGFAAGGGGEEGVDEVRGRGGEEGGKTERVNGAGYPLLRRPLGEGDMGTGVVVMDNVGEGGDWELVRLIVGCNAGVLMKMGVSWEGRKVEG
ncbi:PLC-like phosphodiesterase [Sporormia fimetaria CBS 119925]|uniref:PLC-like phosphodiesterase n=1 Tax=Sporormia fimetaria CBS 119925 TaxID=1340428 RepID=A0A6A6V7I7_9PLEO|nr:PLC-like phosphodiesterase [Sporormia fimetaria CBS 119925]